MTDFTKAVLYTDPDDGRAKFRDEPVELSEGTSTVLLSRLAPSGGYQLRHSPVGYESEFHCTLNPQWVVVLEGAIEVELQDGSRRTFGAGQHFYSTDTVPEAATFDKQMHGHRSRQVGDEPLVTIFVRS